MSEQTMPLMSSRPVRMLGLGALFFLLSKRPGQSKQIAHWRQEDPGVIPAGDVYGGGSPAGIAVYENSALPQKYQGMIMSCEAGHNVVYGYLPDPQGRGLVWRVFIFSPAMPVKTTPVRILRGKT